MPDMSKSWKKVPNPDLEPGLRRYYEHGIKPGGFLRAMLENNLTESFARADDTNAKLMRAWVKWLYNDFDGAAWGSKETVAWWIQSGGITGITGQAASREKSNG